MRKVRILSGNQTGHIVEQRPDEAENNVVSGFAEYVADEPASPPEAEPESAPPGDGDSFSVKRHWQQRAEQAGTMTAADATKALEIEHPVESAGHDESAEPGGRPVHVGGGWYDVPGQDSRVKMTKADAEAWQVDG